MAPREYVILVNEKDKEIGIAKKMAAHLDGGKLHRAFSVFVYNSADQLLMQQRATEKYHSGGLWANTVCSHPRPSENISRAAHRRLREEFGFNTDLEERFSFIYKAELDIGLTEHEYDHVFVGHYDGPVDPNPEEIEEYAWMSIDEVGRAVERYPEIHAPWFNILINQHYSKILPF